MDDSLRMHALGAIGSDKQCFHSQGGQRYDEGLDAQPFCVYGDDLDDVVADADLNAALDLEILDLEQVQEGLMEHGVLERVEELGKESLKEQDDEVWRVLDVMNAQLDEDVDVVYGEVLVCQVNALELEMEHGA